MEDLKLEAALKMGNEANSASGACAVSVRACACVSMTALGSLLTPCSRDHSAEEKTRAWLGTWPVTSTR